VTAEVVDLGVRFDVFPVAREDGRLGPPERIEVRYRPCWRKPAATLELTYLYAERDIAYYGVIHGQTE
jgi:hypothetical protein